VARAGTGRAQAVERQRGHSRTWRCRLAHAPFLPGLLGRRKKVHVPLPPFPDYSAASAKRRAASSVFESSIAIVIGPTPPGTGVMAEATRLTPSKSTSPRILYPA